MVDAVTFLSLCLFLASENIPSLYLLSDKLRHFADVGNGPIVNDDLAGIIIARSPQIVIVYYVLIDGYQRFVPCSRNMDDGRIR